MLLILLAVNKTLLYFLVFRNSYSKCEKAENYCFFTELLKGKQGRYRIHIIINNGDAKLIFFTYFSSCLNARYVNNKPSTIKKIFINLNLLYYKVAWQQAVLVSQEAHYASNVLEKILIWHSRAFIWHKHYLAAKFIILFITRSRPWLLTKRYYCITEDAW